MTPAAGAGTLARLLVRARHQRVEPVVRQSREGEVTAVPADHAVLAVDHADLAQARTLEQCVDEVDAQLADHRRAAQGGRLGVLGDHRLVAAVDHGHRFAGGSLPPRWWGAA